MTQLIATEVSVQCFFRDLVGDALRAERVALTDDATAYLTQLVSEFSRSEVLHMGAGQGEAGTPALFRLYERAINSRPRERFDAYRHLGDVALIVSGFFAPHIERSLVSVDYYVQMGCSAYYRAAVLSTANGVSTLLVQLAERFKRLVEVLTRVAERTTLPVARDVAALYERWLRSSASHNLAERLMSSGVVPVVRLPEGVS
jgi:hypothetical protein